MDGNVGIPAVRGEVLPDHEADFAVRVHPFTHEVDVAGDFEVSVHLHPEEAAGVRIGPEVQAGGGNRIGIGRLVIVHDGRRGDGADVPQLLEDRLFGSRLRLPVHPEHPDILERTVVFVGPDLLDGFQHVLPGDHFPENRILAVQMRAAARFLVGLAHFRGKFHLSVRSGVQAGLGTVQLLVRHGRTHHEAELRGAGLPVGIGVVPFPGCVHGPFPVENALVQAELRRDPPVGFAVAQHLAGLRIAGVRVAALDDEIVDHPVEEQAVEVMRVRQFEEVVPVQGRFVVQFEFHGPHGRLHDHHDLLLRLGSAGGQGQGTGKEKGCESFHFHRV